MGLEYEALGPLVMTWAIVRRRRRAFDLFGVVAKDFCFKEVTICHEERKMIIVMTC